MWLPGHLAFSFLLCLPLVLYLRRERALALACIGTFALLPDLLHLGMLRAFSHSIFGLTLMLAVTLVPMFLLFRPRAAVIAIAVIAATGHLIADFYIGTIWPFYPWDMEWWQIHQFNTSFDIRVELVLSIIAVVVLFFLGPIRSWREIKGYTPRERSLTALLSATTAALAVLQGGYFLLVSPGLIGLRSALLAFIGFTFLAAIVLLQRALGRRPSYAR
jgi:hypothetical protein